MGFTAFDPDSSTNETRDTASGLPKVHVGHQVDRHRAIADLLQHQLLTHTFGVQGEWEVRTTLVTSREAWLYRSSVLLHGKETKKDFASIEVDWTSQIRQAKSVTAEMQTAFAAEAVAVHFSRCASVEEYSLMMSMFSPTPARHHRLQRVVLALFGIAALSTTYWLWRDFTDVGHQQPYGNPPPASVQWQPLRVSYSHPAGEAFEFPLPELQRTPEGIPVDVRLEASGDEPSWLQVDPDRLHIWGTAPLTAADQTYRLVVWARTEQGVESRLLVVFTVSGHADRLAPTPQLPGHWTW